MSGKIYTITSEDENQRLDKWIKRNIADIPQGLLQKILRKGGVKVSGAKKEGSYRLKSGDEILVAESVAADTHPTEKNDNYQIKPKKIPEHWVKEIQNCVIYKDADVIAINKPSGLAVQGGSGIKVSVDDLLEHLKFGAKEKPKLVHRLDKDTSGVLLLARNAKSAAYLTGAFRTKEVEKVYWALVTGVPAIRKGVIRFNMSKKNILDGNSASDRHTGESRYPEKKVDSRLRGNDDPYELMQEDEGGKDSITKYIVLETIGRNFSVLELYPLTGRTHQLRVHTSHIGHPIFGDNKYGERTRNLQAMNITNKLHLHARRVSYKDMSGKRRNIEAPLTGHMKQTWKMLEISK